MKFKLLATTFAFALAMPAAADVLVDNVEGITFDEDGKIAKWREYLDMADLTKKMGVSQDFAGTDELSALVRHDTAPA